MGASIKVGKNVGPKDLDKEMAKKFKGKKKNLSRFFGKLNLKVDPIKFQKNIRNEWE
jgi:hypothetical protein